jgi:MFS family permease
MLALPSIGWLVDKIGRRRSIVFGAAWTLVGAALQGSAHHLAAFIISRFLIGFGLAYTVVASPVLLCELALSKHRGSILAYFPATWYTGAIIAAWVTYGTQFIQNSWSWRIPSLLQAFPAIIQITLIWFVPESPRWLIAKGRGAEAREFLVKYHANGDENSPIVEFGYTQIKEAILQDAQWKKQSSYLDFIRTKPNRRRLIIVTFCGVFLEVSGYSMDWRRGRVLTCPRYLATVSSSTISMPC